MIIVLKSGINDADVDEVCRRIAEMGYGPHVIRGEFKTIVAASLRGHAAKCGRMPPPACRRRACEPRRGAGGYLVSGRFWRVLRPGY